MIEADERGSTSAEISRALDRSLPGEYLLAPHQVAQLQQWLEGWVVCPWCEVDSFRERLHNADCLLAEICEAPREVLGA